MKDHELNVRGEGRPSLLQRAVEREAETVKAQGALAVQHDSLAQLSCRVGDASCAGAHAAEIQRASVDRPPVGGQSLLRLQRQYGNQFVQRVVRLSQEGEGDGQASPDVERAIQGARGGGQALDSGLRAQMEPAFGADFGRVRVHADTQADDLNRSLNARAFTTGQDVFFRQGAYNPGSSGGRELLAHELTHIVQQNGDEVQTKLTVGAPGDRYEQEADRVARAVVRQEQQPVQKTDDEGIMQRQALLPPEDEEEEALQARLKDARLQRQVETGEEEEEEEEALQTQSVQEKEDRPANFA